MSRADRLIADLGLQRHPEGGYFREVFRAPGRVVPEDGRGDRSALTTIYFLLRAGQRSRLHRVASDEVWHFYEGAPLDLYVADDERLTRHVLGAVDEAVRPVAVVPAGAWQAARSTGAYTLVGCSVGPGFDFSDFELIDPDGDAASDLVGRHPELEPFR